MKKHQHWLFLLASLLILSCSKETPLPEEPQVSPAETSSEQSNRTVTLDLSGLHLSFEEDEDLRVKTYDDYTATTNSAGQLVPMPLLTDGQVVELNVAIVSEDGEARAYSRVKATYSGTEKRLIIDGTHEFPLVDMGTGAGSTDPEHYLFPQKQYYICAVYGGEPVHPTGETLFASGGIMGYGISYAYNYGMTSDKVLIPYDVRFEPDANTLLQPVENEGDALKLNIPYLIPWTKIYVNEVKDEAKKRIISFVDREDKSQTYGQLKFKPYGNILALRLGNDTEHTIEIHYAKIHPTKPEKGLFGGYVALQDNGDPPYEGDFPTFGYGTVIDVQHSKLPSDYITAMLLGEYTPWASGQKFWYNYFYWLEQPFTLEPNARRQKTVFLFIPSSRGGESDVLSADNPIQILLGANDDVGEITGQDRNSITLEKLIGKRGRIFNVELNVTKYEEYDEDPWW